MAAFYFCLVTSLNQTALSLKRAGTKHHCLWFKSNSLQPTCCQFLCFGSFSVFQSYLKIKRPAFGSKATCRSLLWKLRHSSRSQPVTSATRGSFITKFYLLSTISLTLLNSVMFRSLFLKQDKFSMHVCYRN